MRENAAWDARDGPETRSRKSFLCWDARDIPGGVPEASKVYQKINSLDVCAFLQPADV